MDRAILKAAAHWHAQLCSGEASDADRKEWSDWLHAHPDHRLAWQRVESLQKLLQQLPVEPSTKALIAGSQQDTDRRRRTLLKGMTGFAIGGGAVWLAHRQMPWPQRFADYRTQIGERREWQLADGSRLLLNTATAVDVNFDEAQRLVRLHAGELLIETGKDSRPFFVRTAQGTMQAWGTRFVVRAQDDATLLTVLEHRVEAIPMQAHDARVLQAGEQVSFNAHRFDETVAVPTATADAWTRGLLIVAGWRLDRFVAEISRYRRDSLDCDPAVAGLHISGAFPIDDTDRALDALVMALPVRLTRREGGLWRLSPGMRVEPR
ncbi:MAG TPA: FecR domain-containing protein [Povalibacter sp.]|uniref:FecR domain-containing protein n=1 Tax=Povalibacter sp. TaxID=1962978 RepID=UPI002B55E787|nr:FecR domain-containing protein [Povalibacter sp.]HMN43763.1 FecR domain-containing protein [Povalibacter sp.]